MKVGPGPYVVSGRGPTFIWRLVPFAGSAADAERLRCGLPWAVSGTTVVAGYPSDCR
jgi:hypothetical protein